MKYINYIILALLILNFGCKEKEADEIDSSPVLSVSDVPVLNESDEDYDYDLIFTLDSEPLTTSSVTVTVEEITASLGKDFRMPNPAIIQFAPGETEKKLSITIIGDNEIEDTKEFFLNLSEPIGLEIKNSAINVILSDDDEKLTNDSLIIPTTGYTTPLSYPGMQLIWNDEFDTTTLDETYWTFETGRGNSGWGNNELQFYQRENTYFEDGKLIIEARNPSGTVYTSSRIKTQDKFEFRYGRVDIRAALPEGQGIWPALWMLGANISDVGWPACGEIDIMELVGGGIKDSEVHGTAHWSNSSNQHAFQGEAYRLNSGKFIDEFHVFSLEWDENIIKWYVDDNLYYSFTISTSDRSEFRNDFFFIFNVAVGGNWPGSPDETTVFPQRMIVDYVRVFQDL